MENHIATGPFDGKITYTTTKDINKIIVTGITTKGATTEPKDIPITSGKVTIKTGTLSDDGKWCNYGPTPVTKEFNLASATQAKITAPKDGKATLEITIDITNAEPAKETTDALDALAALAIPVGPCKVKVADNKITIEITYKDKTKGCTDIEITLTGDNIAAAIATLGLKTGTTYNAETVTMAPPPNHLTITYQTTNGPKKISGPIAKPKAERGTTQGMTAVTTANAEKIKEELKKTAPPNDNKYYHVKDHKTKIRYYFKLKNELEAGKLATGADASIIVQYGHIFAEGFGGWTIYASQHIPKDPPEQGQPEKCDTSKEDNPDNLVHAWIWHFFVILIVIKILVTATLLILK